jgi:HAD superfamily hydrolase (TIGR01509 family)
LRRPEVCRQDRAMQKISLALFDMHDVLCRYDRKRRLEDLSRLSGKPADDIYAAIWGSGFEGEADAGRLDATAYLAGFGARLGYPITLAEWLANRKLATVPMPEVLDIMAELKATTRVAVLTNNHMLVREHLDVLFPELFAICRDDCYVSAQFGAAKPDRAVYLRCVVAAGGVPQETLFIDDSKANVDGAVAAGLAGHLFASAPALRKSLEFYNLL